MNKIANNTEKKTSKRKWGILFVFYTYRNVNLSNLFKLKVHQKMKISKLELLFFNFLLLHFLNSFQLSSSDSSFLTSSFPSYSIVKSSIKFLLFPSLLLLFVLFAFFIVGISILRLVSMIVIFKNNHMIMFS